MDRSTFVSRLDARLRTEDFADVDASANGLQVGGEDGTVEHVAFAVDAAAETIDGAAEAGADLLVTHHGLIWDGIARLTGRQFDLVRRLVEADLGLYVSHLPLDAHTELGNAAGVADLVGVVEREPFGTMGHEHVGLAGRATELTDVESVADRLATQLDLGDGSVRTLPFGPDRIEEVAIVTGSGADWLPEAIDRGVDAFVTGEGKQQVYHEAKEAGVSVVLAGHYATETFGVRSLESLADEWGVETTFLRAPTGL
jgi:dinuclear metal center YbgI/SA1388 family protein